jgi:hypothetical protein
MKKINIAEILKNCPQDMELYSPLCGDCKLYSVNDYNITIEIPNRDSLIVLRRDGTYCANGEIMIFPKGKTTWEGFVPPCKFEDGDVLVHTQNQRFIMSIYHERTTELTIKTHCILWDEDEGLSVGKEICCYVDSVRLATEEEKQKLFKAIEEYGYKWNAETKTLEKLIVPKFKIGDWVVDNYNCVWKIEGILNQFYILECPEGGESRPTINWVDKTFHLWTIQDAKDGDVLSANWRVGANFWERIIIFKKYHSKDVEGLINAPYVEGYGNTFKNGKLIPCAKVPFYSTWTDNLYPATKEQHDLLFQTMKEAGYKWDADNKELKKEETK